ncbi:hypothetical protein [Paenibacillus polymyxa]|uniref:hypothetical protein n=2 Tax=Paenibacillus polymyxa TaxID=1406 RepID=UPI002ED1A9D9
MASVQVVNMVRTDPSVQQGKSYNRPLCGGEYAVSHAFMLVEVQKGKKLFSISLGIPRIPPRR